MVKKRVKATLSFDAEIYKNFQRYCDENAIMLSRTIEIFMDDFFKKKKKKLSFALLFMGMFLIMGSLASAATIFFDNFETGTLTNWTVTNTAGTWHANNTGPIDPPINSWHMISSNSVGIRVTSERNISTSGYQNIIFNFYYKGDTNLLDSPEALTTEWFDGTTWTVILNVTGGSLSNTYALSTNNLNSASNNNANFRIRFGCQSNLGTEGCAIDNVSVLGDIISNSDTTKPVVNLISPINSTTITINISYFAASFTDNINVSNATLYIWNSTSLVGTNFTRLGNSSISANLSFTLPKEGTYFWNYLAYDNSSNFAFNNTNFTLVFSLPDTTPPLISINSPQNSTLNTNVPRLNLTIIEPNIDTIWISLDGGVTNITYAHKNGTISFGYLNLLFAQDFDNYLNGSKASPTWVNLPWFGTAIVENKTYKLYNETPIIDALAFINSSYFSSLDYSGSANVMVPQGYNGSAYLTPRFAGVEWKYEIALDYQFSSININKVVNNVWSSLAALWTGNLPNPIFVSRGEWHNLGFDVFNNNVSAYVDGQLALNVTDSSLNNATFTGFSLISLDDVNGHLAYFDDLELHNKLAYGSHTLTVYANDSFGNANSTTVTFFVNISSDTTLPNVQIIYPINASYNINISALNYTVLDANLQSCWYTLNNGITNASVICGNNASGLKSNEGSNTWMIYANDSAGNVNSSSVTFFKDTINPLISYGIGTESSGSLLRINNIIVNVTASDSNFANISIKLFNSTGLMRTNISANSLFYINYSGLSDGIYYFNASAVDVLNNVNFSEARNVTIDTTIPVINYAANTDNSGAYKSVNIININVSASDLNFANITIRLYNSSFALIRNTTTSASSNNVSYAGLADGLYYFNATAMDLAGNENSLVIRNITIDMTFPLIYFGAGTANDGTNASRNWIYANVSVTEINEANITFRLFNLTGIVNTNTFINGARTINWTVLQDGIYYYNVSIVDSAENFNATATRTITLDTKAPLYSSLTESPAGSTSYVSGQKYEFNSSWNDSHLDKVFIEFNGINYTTQVTNISNVYMFNISNLAAGAYGYYWWANDTSGNYNSSGMRSYNVAKANSDVRMYLNGARNNLTIRYGMQSNASVYANISGVILYRNGNDVTNENGLNKTLSAGYYNYTAYYAGNQNYSLTSETFFLNINQANGTVYTFLNNSRANITITQGNSILLNGTLINGTGNIQLYNNGTLINFGNNLSNLTMFNDIGVYNITTIYLGNENYTASSESWFVNVSSSSINLAPIINSNNTIVNGSMKTPVYGDNFFIKVNVTDTENFTDFVNFSLIAPNGSSVINNKKGINYSSGGNLIWESDNYTINDYGYWNWSYILFDGFNFIQVNGTFRVLSDINIFPPIYEFTPDPKNQTLIWNLSLYHLSNEDYNFSFAHTLNTTYFNLTFTNKSVILNKKIYNDGNLFNNQIRIEISQNVLEDIVYGGNITIMRLLDGKNYTVPLIIGINPPSGNIDAFDLNSVRCSGGNCDVNANMENDESKTFSWILKNTGNHSLRDCKPNITGFGISNFGSFSNNNFNLSIGEFLTLSLTINKPSINTYYGQLETTCKATSSGFNTSLSSESDNAPRIRLLVTADSGSTVSPPSSGSGGGSSGSLGILKPKNMTKIVKMDLRFLEDIILKKGTNGIGRLQVVNTGNVFLNNCKLRFFGDILSWLNNGQIKGLGEGEKFVYDIDVNVPDEGEPGEFLSDVEMVCDEGSGKTKIKVNAYRNSFEGEIGEYERTGGNLKVYYNLKEYSGEYHDITAVYEMKDLDNITRYKGQVRTKLGAKEDKKESIKFKLPKDSFGEFNFKMEFSDGATAINANKTIFLPSSTSPIGLVVSNSTRQRLSFVGVVLISMVVLFFVIRFIYKHHRKTKVVYGHGLKFRKLINLEM